VNKYEYEYEYMMTMMLYPVILKFACVMSWHRCVMNLVFHELCIEFSETF